MITQERPTEVVVHQFKPHDKIIADVMTGKGFNSWAQLGDNVLNKVLKMEVARMESSRLVPPHPRLCSKMTNAFMAECYEVTSFPDKFTKTIAASCITTHSKGSIMEALFAAIYIDFKCNVRKVRDVFIQMYAPQLDTLFRNHYRDKFKGSYV